MRGPLATLWFWLDKVLYIGGAVTLGIWVVEALTGRPFLAGLTLYLVASWLIAGGLVTAFKQGEKHASKQLEALQTKPNFELRVQNGKGKRGVSLVEWVDMTPPEDRRTLIGYDDRAALLPDVVAIRFYIFFDITHHGLQGDTLTFTPQIETNWRLFEGSEAAVSELKLLYTNAQGRQTLAELYMVGEERQSDVMVDVTFKVPTRGPVEGFRVMGGLSRLVLVLHASGGFTDEDYRIEYDVKEVYRQIEQGLTEIVGRAVAARAQGSAVLRNPDLAGVFGILKDLYS